MVTTSVARAGSPPFIDRVTENDMRGRLVQKKKKHAATLRCIIGRLTIFVRRPVWCSFYRGAAVGIRSAEQLRAAQPESKGRRGIGTRACRLAAASSVAS